MITLPFSCAFFNWPFFFVSSFFFLRLLFTLRESQTRNIGLTSGKKFRCDKTTSVGYRTSTIHCGSDIEVRSGTNGMHAKNVFALLHVIYSLFLELKFWKERTHTNTQFCGKLYFTYYFYEEKNLEKRLKERSQRNGKMRKVEIILVQYELREIFSNLLHIFTNIILSIAITPIIALYFN